MSFNKTKKTSPISADTPASYYQKLDELTGGLVSQFAASGTPETQYTPVAYQGVTPEQIRALGGLGASREAAAGQARAQAIEQTLADPSLNAAQKVRAQQLTNEDYSARLDAIKKETEGQITGLAADQAAKQYAAGSEQAGRSYEAALRNAGLSAADLKTLAEIFYGGIRPGTQGGGGFGGSYWG